MAKSIVFDTSTIITLATNNILRILKPLKEKFGGDFYIPQGVKKEIIDNPLKSRRFKLEALQVLAEVSKGNLKIYEGNGEVRKLTDELMELANSMFIARGKPMHIMHLGEVSLLALAEVLDADAIAVDERTTRVLVEDPMFLVKLLESRLHTKIKVDQNKLKDFQDKVKKRPILRSAEFGIVAYEMGLFKEYAESGKSYFQQPKRDLLDALLWAIRLKGCAISTQEIIEILRLEGFAKLK